MHNFQACNYSIFNCNYFQQPNCNIDAKDIDGWTALWHAYSNNNEEICNILLRAGADQYIHNADGVTILGDAKENEDEEMLELFQNFKLRGF